MTTPPVDPTPFFPPFPNVTTRIIWDRWIDTEGAAVEPPTMTYEGGPYTSNLYQSTMWPAKARTASTPSTPDATNVGLWWFEVIVSDDPDLTGEVVIKLSSSRISGGSVLIQVPAGESALHIGDALVVSGPAMGPFQYAGENIALDTDGEPYFVPDPGP
jgi:hypothetical protein